MLAPYEDTLKNFNRLIDRIVDRQVIPFLGAGISFAAHHPGKPNLQNTNKMTKRVADAIAENCVSMRARGSDRGKCQTCLIAAQLFCHRKLDTTGDVELCKYILQKPRVFPDLSCPNRKGGRYEDCIKRINSQASSLTAICEMWEWGCKYDSSRLRLVSDLLDIPEFHKLEPTKAHRYLAFLAREFLISEIITTNYDACMESAYRHSFGDAGENTSDPGKSEALVISNLPAYRDNGGRKLGKHTETRRVNYLKIYKINGDSGTYNTLRDDDEKEQWASSILLTEADLQNWRQRHWAKDLFNDRLRSRTILYSGFGSDEPQVRHTVLQICEEFSFRNDKTSSVNSGKDSVDHTDEGEKAPWWDKPNSPFLTVYDETLSFNQQQILQAYSPLMKSEKHPSELRNVFSGGDMAFFRPGTKEPKLSSDIFFECVYQMAFIRLLRECGNGESPAYQYLIAINPSLQILLPQLVKWIYPEKGGSPFDKSNNMLQLLAIEDAFDDCDSMHSTILSQWVYAVRYGTLTKPDGETDHEIYMALADRQVLIIATLLLVYLIFAEPDGDGDLTPQMSVKGQVDYISGLGLIIKAQPGRGVPWDICITHAAGALQLENNYYIRRSMQLEPTQTVVQIVLGNDFPSPLKRQIYLAYENGEGASAAPGKEQKRVAMIYQIPFPELFRDSKNGGPPDLPSCLERFHKMLTHPAVVVERRGWAARSRAWVKGGVSGE